MNELPSVPRQSERALRQWARHSLIQCRRLLTGWARDLGTATQTLLYPVLLLVMMKIVLGDSVSAATGEPSIFGTVPMITLIAAIYGSVISALGLENEKTSGLLSRFWTMPVHRAAGLTGRLLAEAVRVAVSTLLVVAVGFALGFRFTQGAAAAVGVLALPVLFGVAFAVFVTALATMAQGIVLVNIVGLITSMLLFFNSGFVPVFAYPTWLQPLVAHQPMSLAIDTMRGLSQGGPVAGPLRETLLWIAATILLCAYPAIRGYRRAAQSP